MAEVTGRLSDPAVLSAYNGLARIYRDAGELHESAQWYERSLDVAQRTFGLESEQVARQLSDLAEVLIEDERSEDAESILWRALTIFGRTVSEESPVAIVVRRNLARILEASGRPQEAAEISEHGPFEVFISYHSDDLAIVRELAAKLMERGLRVWLDVWQLRPGDAITSVTSEAIASAAACIVCVGRADRRPHMEREVLLFMERGEANPLVIPVLLRGGEPDRMPNLIRAYQFLDLRHGLTKEGIDSLERSITRRRRRS
jgi:hypothetical protein